eukprot:15135-Heterococcus_DN1.PRE.3
MRSPLCPLSSSTTVMPSAPEPPSSLLGSFRLKASPTTPATGARVARTPSTPFSRTTWPTSRMEAASEPEAGAVSAKQGMISPVARRGRKCCF